MIRPWAEIERFYVDLLPSLPAAPFRDAFAAIRALCSHISDGAHTSVLFGWTSMHDLCIQQVDGEPRSGSFLRISPQQDGTVEFSYCDTMIASRQWSRTVPAAGIIGQFDAFLDQLHWVAG